MKNLFVKSLLLVVFASLLFSSIAVVYAIDDDEPEFMYPSPSIMLLTIDDDEPEFMYPSPSMAL